MQTQNSRFPLPAVEFTFAGFTWPRRVAVLPVGPKAKRLDRYKNPSTGGYYHAPLPVAAPHPGQGCYLESAGAPGLRWSWCDQVEGVRIDHTGWYTDDHGDSDTMRGVVWRLPSLRGFLAGWSMGRNMATSVDADIYETERAAAYAADQLAERAAETEREYQAANRDSEEA